MTIKQTDGIMKNAGAVFFVGVGGVSMSSLALCSVGMGKRVGGSDRSESEMTRKLEGEGVKVVYGHKAENIDGYDAVVYTAAVKSDNPELASAREKGIPTLTRAEYLGWLMSGYEKRIGIAGTHGKSTVTSMTGKIFMEAGAEPTIMVGAEMQEIGGNCLIGGKQYFVFEACEYTDSFLSFCPTTAVVTNIEYDHADYFKNMGQLEDSFESYMRLADTVVCDFDDPEVRETVCKAGITAVSFAIDHDADFRAEGIAYNEKGCASFTLTYKGEKLTDITLSVPGRHNVIDALAAAAASYVNGAPASAIKKGLGEFKGAKRRFEYKGKTRGGAAVYDDYSHHPSEISAIIDAARKFDKRVVCVFQPHTYSRTLALLDGFAEAFDKADETVFAEIYAAREENPGGITSKIISDKTKNGKYIPDFESITEYIGKTATENDVVLVVGAGSITKVSDMLTEQK